MLVVFSNAVPAEKRSVFPSDNLPFCLYKTILTIVEILQLQNRQRERGSE
jgi:hypothetical protein